MKATLCKILVRPSRICLFKSQLVRIWLWKLVMPKRRRQINEKNHVKLLLLDFSNKQAPKQQLAKANAKVHNIHWNVSLLYYITLFLNCVICRQLLQYLHSLYFGLIIKIVFLIFFNTIPNLIFFFVNVIF